MYVSMSELSKMFLYSILLGFFLGAVYDLVRLSRIAVGIKYDTSESSKYAFGKYALIGRFFHLEEKKATHKKEFFLSSFIFLGDIVFCLFSSVAIAIFIYHFNNGEFRAFVLFGAILGFLTYYFTLGKIVIYLSERIVFVFKLASLYILFFIFFPFHFLFCKISRIIWIIIQKNILIIRKLYDIMYISFYSKRCKREILSQASFGFLAEYLKAKGGKI
ncbi:MAG: hypothetical protein E7587_01300 [Ruminococcaceae bacterium]|nr:hypothetical protein [Oscillospiraceae bacterium]